MKILEIKEQSFINAQASHEGYGEHYSSSYQIDLPVVHCKNCKQKHHSLGTSRLQKSFDEIIKPIQVFECNIQKYPNIKNDVIFQLLHPYQKKNLQPLKSAFSSIKKITGTLCFSNIVSIKRK